MEGPQYHLDSVVHAKAERMEDFDGPLDVILLLLSKNKIEIQDISITSILVLSGETTLEELSAYACEMGAPELPGSGRQEYLESIVNHILFT